MFKSCLFLQGPHGPFFRELGRELAARGNKVLRVNFNGGDWLNWHGSDAISFLGKQTEWQAYVEHLYHKYQITDLFLYGDCRSLHQIAILQAKQMGIEIHVFEEGYIRPSWITYERNGVNGNSDLMTDPELLFEASGSLPEDSFEDTEKIGPSTRWILRYCVHYYFFKALLHYKYRNYIIHRPYRPYQELLGTLGSLLRSPLSLYRTFRRRKNLFSTGHSFNLVCLQLDSDAQMRVHSDYLSMANFINEVLRSFAKHAPKNRFLVFKRHPHDSGLIPYETIVRLEAYSLGIRERIRFLYTGSLPELIKSSEGVVLLNSTVGTSSLHHGKPTIVMGRAIYDHPGLTWQGGLDRFWVEAAPPINEMYKVFRQTLFHKALVRGGFYSPLGRKLALHGVIEKMYKNQVQEQSSASKKESSKSVQENNLKYASS